MMVAAESRAWISIGAAFVVRGFDRVGEADLRARADAVLAVDLASVDVDADGIAGEAFLECDVQPWHANFLVTCPERAWRGARYTTSRRRKARESSDRILTRFRIAAELPLARYTFLWSARDVGARRTGRVERANAVVGRAHWRHRAE